MEQQQDDKIVTPRDYTIIELRREYRRKVRKTFIAGLIAGLAIGVLLMWIVNNV